MFAEQNAYAEDLLGPIVLAPEAGHDGKFFFSQAMDPFYMEPETHAVYLDRPTYRAQRMLYPTIASLGGLLGPTATAWGLIVVNLVAMGIGTAVTARLAMEMGLSPWYGLAFLLNPGLIVEIHIDSAGLVATAALMAAVLAAMWNRPWATGGFMAAAVLARETMLLAAVGLAVYFVWQKRKAPLALALPFLAVGGWWAYVHWRLADGLAQDTQAIGLPLVGFIEAFQGLGFNPRSDGRPPDRSGASVRVCRGGRQGGFEDPRPLDWLLLRSPSSPSSCRNRFGHATSTRLGLWRRFSPDTPYSCQPPSRPTGPVGTPRLRSVHSPPSAAGAL